MPLGNAGRIAVCWGILTVGGVYAFVLSKRSVDNRRFETLRVRDRMKKANQGEYDHTISSRRFD
ncbi:hypothetical protein KR215_009284 [Drosophila sulfurigaster]|uniref:Uncharacterized protein LOC117571335 n=1 Tax=Drosophila albomicans TaxID=7291 RepID=A0A6P8X9C1_DROAB|nr:uncharacterized protein LOC117571335 [Drosophila albomicans]XP_060660536.1 uncharacterized protein LOC132794253 [Drosophila nasuta]XP_062136350.1 uncharacterized protein LOC133845794 [Drosophila sulfurigaster albostrigata]KAH8405802.1 hypothetical protein KR215_009284 [Drosophila sulfurigaster]